MRSWNLKALFCVTCIAGATACSDDDQSTGGGALRPFVGTAGASNSAGRGGSAGAPGVAGSGGSAGSNAGRGGGSNVEGRGGLAGIAGSAGAAGAAGAANAAGAAGAAGASAEPSVPDAGALPPEEEPPAEEPPPDEDVVGFSDVYSLLVTRCGQCHSGTPAFLPPFAEPDEAAASALVQPGGLADRIYARAVTDRTMPPACRGGDFGDAGCVSEEEADLLQAWADGGYQP
jgi:hypothetical protein